MYSCSRQWQSTQNRRVVSCILFDPSSRPLYRCASWPSLHPLLPRSTGLHEAAEPLLPRPWLEMRLPERANKPARLNTGLLAPDILAPAVRRLLAPACGAWHRRPKTHSGRHRPPSLHPCDHQRPPSHSECPDTPCMACVIQAPSALTAFPADNYFALCALCALFRPPDVVRRPRQPV